MRFSELYVETRRDLERAVAELGIVPLFRNSVPGFSVAEHVSPRAWFDGENEGVWEWKGPVIRNTGCAYGKFFEKKAVFLSRDWYPDYGNWRRGGLSFDDRYELGLAGFGDKVLYRLLQERGPLSSRTLKALGGFGREGRKGFDGAMLRLQTGGYAVISDFVYELDRHGLPYGWGLAEYALAETVCGEDLSEAAEGRTPEESHARLLARLRELLPETEEKKLARLLG